VKEEKKEEEVGKGKEEEKRGTNEA
jgi:hypothetical protein